jgi:hypothetical protein
MKNNLQCMDVGCFGPFETLYQQQIHKFMRQSVGRSVTRYDICSLVCKVYEKSLSSDNVVLFVFLDFRIKSYSSFIIDKRTILVLLLIKELY